VSAAVVVEEQKKAEGADSYSGRDSCFH